jgi:hypothetical protein
MKELRLQQGFPHNLRFIQDASNGKGGLKLTTGSRTFEWTDALAVAWMEVLERMHQQKGRLLKLRLNGFVVNEPFNRWFDRAQEYHLIQEIQTNSASHLPAISRALSSGNPNFTSLSVRILSPDYHDGLTDYQEHATQFGLAIGGSKYLLNLQMDLIHYHQWMEDFCIAHPLARGLQINESLRKLSLGNWEMSCVTTYLNALRGHPTLEELQLSGTSFPRLTNENENFYILWEELWKENRKLQHLTLSFCNFSPTYYLLLQYSMPFLTHLSLPKAFGGGMSTVQADHLLCELNCPNLQVLDFSRNQIVTLEFTSFLSQDRAFSSQLQQLLLNDNPWLNANPHYIFVWIYKLMQRNPELRTVVDAASTLSREVEAIYHIQRGSAGLDQTSLPLGVWPLILEQANRLLQESALEQAQAIFDLLRGGVILSNPAATLQEINSTTGGPEQKRRRWFGWLQGATFD